MPGGNLGPWLAQQFRSAVRDLGKPCVSQEIGRESDGVSCDQVPAFEQTEPCGPDAGQALQFLDGRLDHVPVLLSAGHAVGDGLHGVQPPRAHPRLTKDHQEHAQAKQNFGCQECRRGHATGEGRPGKMERQQREGEQPRRQFPAPTACAQQRDRRRQQDDPVADFNGDAQGQGIGPQQNSCPGKAHQDGCNDHQGNDEVPAARVEQNGPREQPHGEHESRLHNDQIEGRGNLRGEGMLGEPRNHESRPTHNPDFEKGLTEGAQGEQRSAQQDQQSELRRCRLGQAKVRHRVPDRPEGCVHQVADVRLPCF